MKKFILVFSSILLLVSITSISCKKTDDDQNNPEVNFKIFIYGLTGCHLCTDFEDDLNQNNISYTFYDIDSNNVKRAEMMNKLQIAGIPPDSIKWPVVDVMIDSLSHMFVQPDYEIDIKPLIGY